MAEDPFAGTAAHYARARPGYGEAALDHLDERFGLDGARVLDLGCGAGQVAVPLAARAGQVVAMDPNEAMLAATRERTADAGRENVETHRGSDADLRDGLIEDVAPLDLTTVGRAFHWMDGRATVACLRAATRPGGGIALLDDVEWLTGGTEPWTAAVYEVVAGHLADPPARYEPAEVEYDDPWDELLADCGLAAVREETFAVERTWSVDRIVDYVFSLSFAAPGEFDDAGAVERALRERLAALGGGPFEQTAAVSVVAGRV
ncbi:MAG: class I SAM-dependent methyltransferase [Haloarculaceae archaeon]